MANNLLQMGPLPFFTALVMTLIKCKTDYAMPGELSGHVSKEGGSNLFFERASPLENGSELVTGKFVGEQVCKWTRSVFCSLTLKMQSANGPLVIE